MIEPTVKKMSMGRWFYLPTLAAMLVLFAAFVLYRPDAVTTLGPAGLVQGETSVATFKAPYSGTFTVGLRMNEGEAKKLAPCLADENRFSLTPCRDARPLVVLFEVEARNGSRQVSVADGQGGSYDGTYFRWGSANVFLQRGATYSLTTRTISADNDLAATNPVLALWDSRAGIAEEAGLFRLGATVFASLLLFLGLGWLMIVRQYRGLRMARTRAR